MARSSYFVMKWWWCLLGVNPQYNAQESSTLLSTDAVRHEKQLTWRQTPINKSNNLCECNCIHSLIVKVTEELHIKLFECINLSANKGIKWTSEHERIISEAYVCLDVGSRSRNVYSYIHINCLIYWLAFGRNLGHYCPPMRFVMKNSSPDAKRQSINQTIYVNVTVYIPWSWAHIQTCVFHLFVFFSFFVLVHLHNWLLFKASRH
jgi:uncharacterized protein Veg